MIYTPDQLLVRALDVLSRCASSVDEADACRELLELVHAGRARVVVDLGDFDQAIVHPLPTAAELDELDDYVETK